MFSIFKKYFRLLVSRDFFIKEYDTTHRKNSDYEEFIRSNPLAFITARTNITLTEDQKRVINSFTDHGSVCVKHVRRCGMTTVYMLLCSWLISMYQNYTIVYVSPNQKRGQDFLKLVFKTLSGFVDQDQIRIVDNRYIKIISPNKTESYIYITSSTKDYNTNCRGNGFINTVFFDNSTNIFNLDYIFPALTSHLNIPKEYSLDYNSFPPEGFICSSEETPYLASPATIFFEKVFNDDSYLPLEITTPY